jgi:hypothetical protein
VKVFENGVMRKVFWPNTEEVILWKNVLNNDLKDFFS